MAKSILEIKAKDKASKELSSVSNQIGRLERGQQNVNRANKNLSKSSKKATKSTESMGKSFLKASLATEAISQGLEQVVAFGQESITTFIELEQTSTRYEFAMKQAGATSMQMARAQGAMQAGFENAGFSMESQQQAMQVLVRRLGDADEAARLLKDAQDLSAASGQDLADSAQDISEAATGDINALEQLGILTESQTDRFREMEDSTERAGAALDVLRDKVGGASEELDTQGAKISRLSAGWRELKGATGEALVVNAEAITGAQDGGKALSKLAGVIEYTVERYKEYEKLTRNADEPISEQTDERFAIQLKLADAIGMNTDLMRKERQAMIDSDRALEEWSENVDRYGEDSAEAAKSQREWAAAQRVLGKEVEDQVAISERTQTSLATLKVLYGEIRDEAKDAAGPAGIQAFNKALGFSKEIIDNTDWSALRKEVLGLKTDEERAEEKRSQAEAERLAALRSRRKEQERIATFEQEIARTRLRLLTETNKEQQAFLEAHIRDLEILKDSLQGYEKERAELENQLELQDALYDIEARRNELSYERIDALEQIEYQEREATFVPQVGGGQATPFAIEGTEDPRSIARAQQAEQTARQNAPRDIGAGVGQSLGGVGRLVSESNREASEAMREQNSLLRTRLDQMVELGEITREQARLRLETNEREIEQNEALNAQRAETIEAMSRIAVETGALGSELAELASSNWDFAKASDAAVAASSALSQVGAATAGILGESIQAEAGIQAAFEAANAAAMTALAIAYPNPAYTASAIQHGVAAGMFGAVAAGAGGASTSTSPSVPGGGSSGSGSRTAPSAADVNPREQAQAFKDSMVAALNEAQGGGQNINIYLNDNVMLEDSRVVGDRLARTVERSMQGEQ